MTRIARTLAASAITALAMLTTGALPATAKSTTAITTGNDISWPQCGGSFPVGQAFGIVGVNDGLANTLNPCLGEDNGGSLSTSELSWAWQSTGKSAPGVAPKAALYVNTADPGQVVPVVADWPKSNTDPNGQVITDPYGPCNGSDSPACAWQYGWNRAVQDVTWLSGAATQVGVASAASAYRWWLDVETGNSWETGSGGLVNNVADLQGMVAAFEAVSATVGIYSTSSQWNQITGSSRAGNLNLLPDWIPGARTLSGAPSNCSVAGFTGTVMVTQWFGHPYDGDYAC